jgi:hypothetical protein
MQTFTFMQQIIFCCFFSVFIFCCSSLSQAEPTPLPAVGQVVWVKGTLKAAQPNAPPRVLARRSPIYEHDSLMTDPTGTGEVVFTDNSVLSVREDSIIQIDQYKFQPGAAPGSDAFVANVIKGGFRTITGTISKNNPGGYHATTPVATIGVSGTVYSVYFNPAKGDMSAKIDQGNIVVSNSRGRVVLTKCNSQDSKEKLCVEQRYAQVSNVNAAPVALQQQPTVFNAEPPLVSTSFPKASTGGGLVGSFCIS